MLGNRIIDDSTVINKMYLRPMHAHTEKQKLHWRVRERERNSRKVNNYQRVCLQESLCPCFQSEKKKKFPP